MALPDEQVVAAWADTTAALGHVGLIEVAYRSIRTQLGALTSWQQLGMFPGSVVRNATSAAQVQEGQPQRSGR